MAFDPFRGLNPLERMKQQAADRQRQAEKERQRKEKQRMATASQQPSFSVPGRGETVRITIPGNPMDDQTGVVRDVQMDPYSAVPTVFVDIGWQVFACLASQVRSMSAPSQATRANSLQQALNQLVSAGSISQLQHFTQYFNSAPGTIAPHLTSPNPTGTTTPMSLPTTHADLSDEAVKRRAEGRPRFYDFVPGDEATLPDGRVYTFTRIEDTRIYFDVSENGNVRLRDDYWHRADGDTPFSSRVTFANTKKKKLTFNDVILPADKKQAIMDAVKQLDNYKLIFDEWGFGDTLEKGKAVSMLFFGPPGTGKTMIAQAIADEYDLKLKMISTAEIESSEPGQAERNIKAYFDGAKDGKTLLFFDECDSLIADRRDVGMILGAQINALLTSLENYEGIAIFATNRLEKMDEAFDRRLSLKLEFELPTQEDRARIWRRLFPDKAPLAADVDWDELASVEISGGYIKNVVLQAARRAANSDEKQITHQMLVDALINEVERMTQFQDAIKRNPTPGYRGGGHSVSRTITPKATMTQG